FIRLAGAAPAARAQLLWYYNQHDNEPLPAAMGLNAGSSFDPASLLHGSLPTKAGFFTEVVVEQHVLHPGESVPLPTYSDGTAALESEVFWTAHLWQANFNKDYCPYEARYETADMVYANFDGRTFVGGFG